MPYIKWTGITLDGLLLSGKERAYSIDDLTHHLESKDIGFIKATIINPISWFRPITLNMRASFFEQLATLLQVGVFLDHALNVAAKTAHHPVMQQAITELRETVAEGFSLSYACAQQPYLFDPITVSVLYAGAQAESLADACAQLSLYMRTVETFRHDIKRALLMPAITAGIFVLILFLLLAYVVPLVASVISSLGKSVPLVTCILLSLSDGVKAISFFHILVIIFVCFIFFKIINRHGYVKKVMFMLPGINRIVMRMQITFSLMSLGLLLRNGVPLVQALSLVADGMQQYALHHDLKEIMMRVAAGNSLSDAMHQQNWPIGDEIYALLILGQESGALAAMVTKAAEIMHAQMTKRLRFLSTIAQPLLLILLGCLVVAMILGLYMPILDLSQQIG